MSSSKILWTPAAWMFSLALGLALGGRAFGEEDRVTATLRAEVDRTMKKIVLDDSPRPYFVSCTVSQGQSAHAGATLGALVRSVEGRYANVRVVVRVGDYQLDNSNFLPRQMWGGWSEFDMPMEVPIDGNLDIMRRAVWWAMDQAYKRAVEDLKRKKAVLKNLSSLPVADDFARAPVLSHVSARKPQALPALKQLEDHVRQVSRVLDRNRLLRKSRTDAAVAAQEWWQVNSEGTAVHEVINLASVRTVATAQCDDGVLVGDIIDFTAENYAALPSAAKQTAEVLDLGKRVEAMRAAPLQDDFIGPVLFEGQAAAELCARILPASFSSRRDPITEEKGMGDWMGAGKKGSLRRKIGRRVMATSFNVTDDPTVETFDGVRCLGRVEVDFEGVRPEKVPLVENGILKTLLTTRTPDKRLPRSNGHALSQGYGMGGPTLGTDITTLFVTCKDGIEDAKLRDRLVQAVKDQEVPYGLRVRRVPSPDLKYEYDAEHMMFDPDDEKESVIRESLYVFRVYPDGHEEQVRVVSFKGIELAAFKDILAAGKTPFVYNRNGSQGIVTLVCPSLLFEEGMVQNPEKDIAKPPLLPSPMAE